MQQDNSAPQKPRANFLVKMVFGLGVALFMGSALMIAGTWASKRVEQVSAENGNASAVSMFSQLSAYVSTVFEKPKPRWELDQAALPKTPEGWEMLVSVGGGQSHALAKEVYRAMHQSDGALDVEALAVLAAMQQPSGLMSDALAGARNSMQAMGATEAEAEAQTAVSSPMVQLGDRIARANDAFDQGRVYILGENVVMVMVRRLPRTYTAKGSWLQRASQGRNVPVELGGYTFMESSATAESDDIHALRLDITDDLFIEVGGRVQRDILENFVRDIDFGSL